MKTILNILTLGLYSFFSKKKDYSIEKNTKKYRKDGTLKKEVTLDADYSEGDGLTNLPK